VTDIILDRIGVCTSMLRVAVLGVAFAPAALVAEAPTSGARVP